MIKTEPTMLQPSPRNVRETVIRSAASLVMMVAVVFAGSAAGHASDAVCVNPEGPMIAICEDPKLMALNLQVNILHGRFLPQPNAELPEARQMELGHHHIALEECNGKFRCIEAQLTSFLDEWTNIYLRGAGKVFAAHQRVRFQPYSRRDSPGHDIVPSTSPRNYGWTERLCQLRCAIEKRCVAAGYDVMQQRNHVFGYCTLKRSATFPLKKWTEHGVFLFKL
jgi:hypothetical protein